MKLKIYSLQVPLRQSEVYISDILDDICKKMADYVRATKKSNNQLTILKLVSDSGMNPLMSKVDVIQDGDLNKSLEHYVSITLCLCAYILYTFGIFLSPLKSLYIYFFSVAVL